MKRSQWVVCGFGALGLVVAATAVTMASSAPRAAGVGPVRQVADYGVLRVQLARQGARSPSRRPARRSLPSAKR